MPADAGERPEPIAGFTSLARLRMNKEQSKLQAKALWAWFPAVLKSDTRRIIQFNGLDAYQFVKFLEMMLWIFVPFWIVSWVILMPVDAAVSGGNLTGVERFTFGSQSTFSP